MSLANAPQQATRRLTVLQSRDAIREQVKRAQQARKIGAPYQIKLRVRVRPETRPFDLIFTYQHVTRRRRHSIILGKSITGEHVRVYVPSNPDEAVEAVLH